MRILLIEDEKELADALSAALSKRGIVIDHTMLLGDAIELSRQHSYDAILLDRRLPDGVSTHAGIRKTGFRISGTSVPSGSSIAGISSPNSDRQ